MKNGLTLMENVLMPSAESVLIVVELTVAKSVTDNLKEKNMKNSLFSLRIWFTDKRCQQRNLK